MDASTMLKIVQTSNTYASHPQPKFHGITFRIQSGPRRINPRVTLAIVYPDPRGQESKTSGFRSTNLSPTDGYRGEAARVRKVLRPRVTNLRRDPVLTNRAEDFFFSFFFSFFFLPIVPCARARERERHVMGVHRCAARSPNYADGRRGTFKTSLS